MTLKILILALATLPISKEDRPVTPAKKAEMDQVAASVFKYSEGNLEVMAMTLMLGQHESAFSSRIGRSECKPKECDPRRVKGKLEHRARGFWQLHKNGLSDAEWAALHGPGTIDAQAKEAVRRVRSAFATCRGEPDWPRAAIAQYAGAGCRGAHKLKDMNARVKTYSQVRRFIP